MTKGQRIKQAREAMGWYQHQLAKAVGVEPPTVSRWENEIIEPDAQSIKAIAQALEKPVEWFLSETNTTAIERRLESLEKQRGAIPKILFSLWPVATPDAKAACLWILTRRKEYYDFLPHETQSALVVLGRVLGNPPPKPSK